MFLISFINITFLLPKQLILKAKEAQPLNAATVISACDKLSSKLSKDDIKLLIDMGVPQYKAEKEFKFLKLMLSKEYLENRLKTEFGTSDTYEYEEEYKPYGYDVNVRHKFVPLGTLFHISAGNVELLAAFSIIEIGDRVFIEKAWNFNKSCLVLHSLCYINPARLWSNFEKERIYG